ncbi:MAG: hypothetical protein LUG54_05690 [Clostridiales bacterium]|nr:hypothetical protein [Clostridiales bacterium]
MKGGRMSSVNILGTCVCRDIFGFHENDGGYKIDRFIQSVNPVSGVMKTLPSEDRFQAEVTALSKLNNFL